MREAKRSVRADGQPLWRKIGTGLSIVSRIAATSGQFSCKTVRKNEHPCTGAVEKA
ncbi:hypothetical protein KCP75_22710 [Salmonella enterica subsp. enterica]|nr:hypothetical protein KCP75_22710 [Salmonella enterica subsp. enterica]